jgi:DNA-binding MarR family transcriptional regulator
MAKLSPAAQLFSEIVIEVFRLNGLALQAGEQLSGPVGLTSARWQVLGVVDHAPASVAHVARTMGLRRQSVQLTADALERDGFIAYVDNPHHLRAKLISITKQGTKALRDVEARHALWANRLGKRTDRATMESALEGLRAIRGLLEQDESID